MAADRNTLEEQGIVIVGTGFVADLYMRSIMTFPNLRVVKAFDTNPKRLASFCAHWKVLAAKSLEDLLSTEQASLLLNLTNPRAHFEISQRALNAGKHVYSEKPLALNMPDAKALYELAITKKLLLCSAPCSLLGEAAQTVWRAIRDGEIGKPRLVYAELDDNFIANAPYKKWISESGAPWPFVDEFEVGCTMEHAGYYLTWLIAMFGPVKSVTSFAHGIVISERFPELKTAPDYSCASLLFHSGMVARLTCSIVAKHNHQMQVTGDTGVLEIAECWNNKAKVYVRKRLVVRRRLMDSPLRRRVKIGGPTHPHVGRWGAASMNFALGPVEMLESIKENRPCLLTAELALHLNEVTLAIHSSAKDETTKKMLTSCGAILPAAWANR